MNRLDGKRTNGQTDGRPLYVMSNAKMMLDKLLHKVEGVPVTCDGTSSCEFVREKVSEGKGSVTNLQNGHREWHKKEAIQQLRR